MAIYKYEGLNLGGEFVDISKIEKYMGTSMSKDMLKKMVGDGPEFDIMYEAFLKEQEQNLKGNEENRIVSATTGQKLEDIPMTLRREPIKTGVLYSNNYKDNYDDINVSTGSKPEAGSLKERIYSAVDRYSKKHGVDKNLVLAIIKQESNFNPSAVSSAGAKGVMQLMDFNCTSYGVTNPFDIDQNVEAGIKLLKSYLDTFGGNVEMGLMAYNGGPGNMQRRGVKSPSDLYKMPSETQAYVPKVMKNYRNGI